MYFAGFVEGAQAVRYCCTVTLQKKKKGDIISFSFTHLPSFFCEFRFFHQKQEKTHTLNFSFFCFDASRHELEQLYFSYSLPTQKTLCEKVASRVTYFFLCSQQTHSHARLSEMPPLTLEQVLARSMRLPRSRPQRHVTKLFQESRSIGDNNYNSNSSSRSNTGGAFTDPLTSLSFDGSSSPPRRGAHPPPVSSDRQERLNFFDLMDRDEAARQTGRLSIHRSDTLVRNSTDLTTFLNAARQTGDWEDGLRAFAQATALPAFTALLQPFSPSPPTAAPTSSVYGSSALSSPPPPPPSPSLLTGINPNLGHVMTLLDMFAEARRYDLVERVGAFFAPAFPEALTHTVELLVTRAAAEAPTAVAAAASSSASSSTGWRAGFEYLTQRCALPAAEVPAEAFNVCLRGCEATKDWRGALKVVRAMGPNPLQGWTAPKEEEEGENTSTAASASAGGGGESGEANTSDVPPSDSPGAANSVSIPPAPNVVSYATLIATLEQAGKDHVASAVLNRLPALEKEEITASYAALIVVWSNQVQHKHRRRF